MDPTEPRRRPRTIVLAVILLLAVAAFIVFGVSELTGHSPARPPASAR
jgi:hypothetical protein